LLEKGIYFSGIDIVSDNCKNQNKCCKYFWFLANLCEDLLPRLAVQKLKHEEAVIDPQVERLDASTVEGMKGIKSIAGLNDHIGGSPLEPEWVDSLKFTIGQQYSEPMQGKGGHDGDAAVIKRIVFNKELSMIRSPNGKGVFRTTTTEYLGEKDGIKAMNPNRVEWEKRGDK
jgi:hypothetical protein